MCGCACHCRRLEVNKNFIRQSSYLLPSNLLLDVQRWHCFWADIVGAKYIVSRLNTWMKAYGDFFKPCAFLEEHTANGVKLVFFSVWDVMTFL